MDKNAIKKYAVWARNELIQRVTQKALQYEITNESKADVNADSVNGKLITPVEIKQRQALINQINEKGFEQVIEEVAYTWFNRFCALRFMEVNGYLPTHIRVFTDEDNNFKPQILAEAIHLELDGLNMDKVYELKESNKDEELYKYLLITQCNNLNKILPGMFQKIADYTELLLPDNLLRDGSVIQQMIEVIPQENFDINSENGQVEIIGWLYQYYISEKHEEVVNISTKEPIEKKDVPAATQLFTTDWVVQYIIDNSVGRYWIERNPESSLREKLDYFVHSKDGHISVVDEKIKPEDLTVFDPCIGSAHFAVYSFDVLMKIYTEYGYTEREAATSIVENNIFGLDIDERAAQLAYFAVMMKGRQYDRHFLSRGIQPHIYDIQESKPVSSMSIFNYCGEQKSTALKLYETFKDAKEYGTILEVDITTEELDALEGCLTEAYKMNNLGTLMAFAETTELITVLTPLIIQAKIMARKYTVVATNPPYFNRYDDKLKSFITDNYKDYSGDLFSIFIYRNFKYTIPNGYSGFMTPFVWMFIKSYEKLRGYIISSKSIITLIQLEYSAFEEATVPICTFVLKNGQESLNGLYFKLSDFKGGMEVQKQKTLEALENLDCGYFYETSISNYKRITGSPIAFWASEEMITAFEKYLTVAELAPPKQGLATANNEVFLKLWFEPSIEKIGFGMNNCQEAKNSGLKWFPYNKGGAFRRWYGNRSYVVNWENDGYEIKNFRDENGKVRSRPQNLSYYFRPAITWSDITSSSFSGRFSEHGFIFDIKGSSGFPDEDKIYYILGFLNSLVSQKCIKILNPTITTQVGDMARIPVAFDANKKKIVDVLVKENIEIAKFDWDSFETSWDFKKHPLVRPVSSIKEAFFEWKEECDERFEKLKSNEEKINRAFIDLYGLQSELNPDVCDKDVESSCRHANCKRDIKGLISYAVGCMFGRYSLDIDGLVYAGGQWDDINYESFPPDKDNIIQMCDDEYFDDDIVGRFVKFIEVVYGNEMLDENLRFIAEVLGGKGQPKDVIRSYFMNEFFYDHCSEYAISGSGKRPIYWLFDSGKKNGFKALIYMHRYQPDTIARIRTDYVHEQQARYRTSIEDIKQRINSASTSERVKLNKELTKLKEKAAELKTYEEKIHHLADQMIPIDLDDGVKANYEIFKDVLAKIK
ncbi:BREX-1 system adenine-specific DNA-methyltransferase PglX [Clostridium neonatale]|uniref:BREX-1 system adenine-specific DNA-methyltransferase PglX n=1 Tax=Clostridium neonatale TaxID=137838 RepID=UPI00291B91EE|nr:Adenine-specific methyltransferase PglX [Clostridium neonatale]CAI3585307.1 Adenine-specific methyltransferase PglX [Clostridium neonatale]CAI3614267.1 Adenine-specific methyltransferase PglX [Clostridium neonatale]CAI3629210.1 Adenine-specific methyltransferase PglX [Clostridium neonatale]CAI3683982.1 Adenine-specific methyltransferase PglX [Clostridium neonatale]